MKIMVFFFIFYSCRIDIILQFALGKPQKPKEKVKILKASKVLQKVSFNRYVVNYPYQKPEENQEVEDKKSEEKTFFLPQVPIEKIPKFKALNLAILDR